MKNILIALFTLSFVTPLYGGEKKAGQVINPEQLKKLISEAAALDRRLWDRILKSGAANPAFLAQEGGETLTFHVISIILTPGALKPDVKEFIGFKTNPPNVTKVSEAFDPLPKGTGLVSVLHPEYIRSLAWEVTGDAIKGTFNFESANGAYDGAAGFVAQYAEAENPSSLYVSAFILEPDGIKLIRESPEKKWKQASPKAGP